MTVVRFRPSTTTTSPDDIVPCGVSVNIGDLVYISASGTLQKAKANSISTMPAIGTVDTKPTTTSCTIKQHFFLDLASTNKKEYFVSTTSAGQMQDTPPQNALEVVQKVGQGLGTAKRKIDVEPNSYILRK